MSYFLVNGPCTLNGEITIPGAKNAVLPMLCASLLTKETCIFTNVPEISDVAILLDVFQFIGAETSWDKEKKEIKVTAKNIQPEKLKTCEDLKKLRATILLLGPILARFGECCIARPGGDIIGARPNFIHTDGFQSLGYELIREDSLLSMKEKTKTPEKVRLLLSEASVTGTENLAICLAGTNCDAEIYFAAAEPHVQATLNMLAKMGAEIEGSGTHHIKIKGKTDLKGGTFEIPPDGILVGTYMIAGLLSQGEIKINNVDHNEMFSFYGLLKRMGAQFEMKENAIHVFPSPNLKAIKKVQTAIFPGVSSDLQSLLGVLLTQCEGENIIFETLYEGRLTYLQELEKMGAKTEILSPHRAKITGKTELFGAEVQSWDLRAGATMVLAGLIAKGQTKVNNIVYIDRGYEHFEKNLQSLGANIQRINE